MNSRMKKQTSWLVTAFAIGLPLAAASQTDPANPGSAAPALRYQSAFADYKPWQDLQPSNWRGMNESLRGQGSGNPGPASPPAAVQPVKPAGAAPAAVQSAPARSGHGVHHTPEGQK